MQRCPALQVVVTTFYSINLYNFALIYLHYTPFRGCTFNLSDGYGTLIRIIGSGQRLMLSSERIPL